MIIITLHNYIGNVKQTKDKALSTVRETVTTTCGKNFKHPKEVERT